MSKKVQKHIKEKNFVKVSLSGKKDQHLTHFAGIIINENKSLIMMTDQTDFNYDGCVIIRKSAISEIKHSDNERFFKSILKKEKLINEFITKASALRLELSSLKNIFKQLKGSNKSVIIECLYGKDDRFVLGKVSDIKKSRVRIDYVNSLGEFDLKPVSVDFKDITQVTIDSPYANMFIKYGKH